MIKNTYFIVLCVFCLLCIHCGDDTSENLDETPPSTVKNLKATVNNTQLKLTWNKATDNIGVDKYKIYKNDALLETTADTIYTVSELSINATYNFRVSAIDATGNEGDKSDLLQITIPDTSTQTSDYDFEFFDDFEGSRDYTFWAGEGISLNYGYDDPTHSGNKIMRMSYIFNSEGKGDSWTEYDFKLPINATFVEMSFEMYTPENYYHFEKNHKLYALWSGEYGKTNANISVASEMWGREKGGATPSIYVGVDKNNYGHTEVIGSPLILEDYDGSWSTYKIKLQLATSETDFGYLEVYKNNTIITSTNFTNLTKPYSSAPEPSELIRYSTLGNFIDQGTLLGWANGADERSYDSDIHFLIDNFSLKAKQ